MLNADRRTCSAHALGAMAFVALEQTVDEIRALPPSSDDDLEAAKEVLRKLARVLARQAAREDNALEEAREGTPSCASPSTPDSVRTSRTRDP
jgi:hypothetical protein